MQGADQQLSSSSSSDVRSGTSSSTNSDSGIGYRDDPENILLMDPQSPPIGIASVESSDNAVQENVENEEKEKFDVRAMPPPKDLPLSPDAVGASGGVGAVSGLADCSFNTEVLDSQHSAANLRQSMQKYLQSKHDHLKKTSQQLVSVDSRQTSKPRLVTPTSSSASASSTRDPGRRNLFHDVRMSSVFNRGASSDRSSVRSLEDVRFDVETVADFSPPPTSFKSNEIFSAATATTSNRFPTSSSSMLDSSPLARFLYNSETNLSQLAESQMSREQPLLSLMPGSFHFISRPQ